MKRTWICLITIAGTAVAAELHAQHTQRGAVLGGLTGAAAGAVIGNQNGETAEGALIGSAVGLLSGALIGNSIDAEQSRQRYVQRQYMAQRAQAVSISEVLSLTKSGVSEAVIINHIHQHGVQRRLDVSDVILLHEQGVSESVLAALQRARIGGTTPVYSSPPATYAPAPVIVREHHYIRPAYPVYRPRYHHHHFYYPPVAH